MFVNYPNGIMRNYRRPIFRRSRHRKYHNYKIKRDGHVLDSKVEYQYYLLLKAEHKRFKCHQRYELLPHAEINGIKCRKRNYTDDFSIYDDQGNLIEADDIKGIKQIPPYDTLRFSLFERRYRVPVVIIRKEHGRFKRQVKQF